jgi:hypothetical protein
MSEILWRTSMIAFDLSKCSRIGDVDSIISEGECYTVESKEATGITRMRNAAETASVAEPEFRIADYFKVTVRRPPVDESKAILEAGGQMSSTAIAEKAGLTAGRIRTILREMVAEEIIGRNAKPDITFEITKSLCILAGSAKGWTKELNLVSWNGREPKYDIREWSPDHEAVKHHAAKPLCFSHGTYIDLLSQIGLRLQRWARA